MPTLKTPHATVTHDKTFSAIEIKLDDPAVPLSLMDIQKIYVEFYRQYLEERVKDMKPMEIIRLSLLVGKEF